MPRPTPAQLAYGSATVVFSTLAMLLLSQARSGPGVALIAVVALAAGVLVALTAPGVRTARAARTGFRARAGAVRTRTSSPSPSRIHARHDAAAVRNAGRVAEPSLRS
ncbi:hypothetical protein [Streptomyces winkii]|uniref:hypothetical protein n=1 Tax=Streptomyces winkii TaxID=3051178 RepID=UPI0028D5A1C7|nr:hypothetical protein [Streptomyces sp. DSM 40971]